MLPELFPKELLYIDLKLLPSEFLKGEPKQRYYSQLSPENINEKPVLEYYPLFFDYYIINSLIFQAL